MQPILKRERGGRGILLGGVPGVPPANVTIIGGGIVGTNAAKIALGFGAARSRWLTSIFIAFANSTIYTVVASILSLQIATTSRLPHVKPISLSAECLSPAQLRPSL